MARKRKDSCVHNGGLREKPVQRNAANARERARMRVLSKAFSRLKTTLPWVPADTKLSKLDTLRLAASYIAHLRQILLDENNEGQMIHPINLTWPFTFNAARAQDEDNAAASAMSTTEHDHHHHHHHNNHHHHHHHTSVSSDCPFGQEMMDYDYSNELHVP